MIIIETLKDAIFFVLEILYADSLYLCLGILMAVSIRVYVDMNKIKSYLVKRSGVSILSVVAFGAFTPFCACGSMAITVSMFAATLPWGPIMAFLTSSALMCPTTFVLYSGVAGVGFATAAAFASIFIGTGSGYATVFLEKRTNFFQDQLRITDKNTCNTGCCTSSSVLAYYDLESLRKKDLLKKLKIDRFIEELYRIGVRIVLPYFCLFAFLSFFVEKFVPKALIVAWFGGGHLYSVPIAALIGLPLYVGSAAAMPLMQTLMKAGASQGALLAFLITGPGTSIAVLTGLGVMIRKKALGIYILFMLLGAVISGYLYDLYLMLFKGA